MTGCQGAFRPQARPLLRGGSWWAVAVPLVLAAVAGMIAACDWTSPTEPERPTPTPMVRPTPTVTPTPPVYPPGVANATALENLALVTGLETAAVQQSILVRIAGYGELTGRIASGSGWEYSFVRGGGEIEGVWTVWYDGRVQFFSYQPPIHTYETPGIEGSLFIDSPAAIQKALEAGVSAFTAVHPDAIVRARYWRKFGRVICEMQFYDRLHIDRCEPEVYVDAATGEVVYTALECIGSSSRRRR